MSATDAMLREETIVRIRVGLFKGGGLPSP